MFHADLVADVLHHLSPQCYGQRLNATADTKDGHLPVVGQPGDEQLREVALLIDTVQTFDRLFAGIERIDVASPAEDECVNMVERVHQHVGVGGGGDDYRCAPSLYHGVVIPPS